ncbi:MAG: FtsX-like permease family protein [Clostridia bacterium]
MMLFKLSLKNIKKSMKDYAIYFFTLILGVAIFYVFNSIGSQTAMMTVSKSTSEILKLMTQILSGVSVFVSFILAFLIIYASRFLMKRRKKEFGVYMTLGMSKRKISLILFFETLFIGIISLTVGLLAGTVLSQFMSVVVADMFEADMTKFKFVFSESACIKTLIYFGIMYLVVMIFNTFNISKCKLIDLIYGNRKSEAVKLKNPWLCIIIFMVSACALGYSYYAVTEGINEVLSTNKRMLAIIAIGSISTFFISWSLSGLILKIVKSNKKFYYKGLNSFTVRQISSKINTTVFSMTVICLMLFITICVLSSALSMKNSLNRSFESYAPRDVELSKRCDIDEDLKDYGYTDEQIEGSKMSIKEILDKLDFDYQKYFKNIEEYAIYTNNEVNLKSVLGDYYENASSKYSSLIYDHKVELMKLSDYNKLVKSLNLKKISLDDNQYAYVANYEMSVNLENNALKTNPKIVIDGKEYLPRYDKCVDGFYEMAGNKINDGFIVLPDSAFVNSKKTFEFLVADYNGETDKIEEMVNDLINRDYYKNTNLTINTKADIRDSSVGLGAIVTFIGLYLGIIFLISCAAILALKELSESSDNFIRFEMLRKIGVDEKDLNKALFRQIEIFFMFPLLIAIIHSIFGIKFSNYILKASGVSFDLNSIIMTAVFIVIIYGGYFVVTYFSSKNIIREKN